jgi:hypothetical protein
LGLVLVALATAPAWADSTIGDHKASKAEWCAPPTGEAAAPHSCLVAATWSDRWHQFYHPVERALASRQRMLQFGAVGMMIALFIIWYRQPRGQ